MSMDYQQSHNIPPDKRDDQAPFGVWSVMENSKGGGEREGRSKAPKKAY